MTSLKITLTYTMPDSPITVQDEINTTLMDQTPEAYIASIKSGVLSVLTGGNQAFTFGDGINDPLIWYPAEILKRMKITIQKMPDKAY